MRRLWSKSPLTSIPLHASLLLPFIARLKILPAGYIEAVSHHKSDWARMDGLRPEAYTRTRGRVMKHLRALAVILSGLCLPTIFFARSQVTQLPAEKKPKHVWTNEDLERLREKPGVSVVGMPPSVEPDKKRPTTPAAPHDQEKDPSWYRRQLSPLRVRLNDIDAQIRELQKYRSITAYMVGEVVIPNLAGAPLNAEDQIKQLEVQRRDIALKIGEIEDLARHNDIAPGEIR